MSKNSIIDQQEDNIENKTSWIDFDAWKAEKEWLDELQNNLKQLLPFNIGIGLQNINHPLTKYNMANLTKTRTKEEKEKVEKYMQNSIEYVNPKLKDDLKIRFNKYTNDDDKRVRNLKVIEDHLRYTPNKSIGSIKVNENFIGFITYRDKPINWELDEKRIDFNGYESFIFTLKLIQ